MGRIAESPPESPSKTYSFNSEADDRLLPRTLGFKSACAIAVAAMTGSCLVLPAGASYYSGTSAFLSILLAGILVTPHSICVSELASAMPINGGDFVYLSQAYGPLIGTCCGVGLYASLLLKGSFGLVGSIYYLEAVTGELEEWVKIVVKMGILVLITVLNLQGMKKLKKVQKQFTMIATLLLFILGLFAFKEFDNKSMKQDKLFTHGFEGVLQGAAFVYMSFAGITKICSVGGEIKKPGQTLPKSIKTATFGMTLFFSLTTLALVGCIDLDKLKKDYAPFYTMGLKAGGGVLGWMTAILCIATMIGMANVAIAAVSRFPYAMARDGLLPDVLTKTFKNGSPYWCILLSSFTMGVCVLTIDVKGIAKLASSFNLIVFISDDLSLMIYRTHGKNQYNPEYEAPFYPILPMCGVVGQIVLLVVIGPEGIFAVLVFGILGLLLYLVHGRHHTRFLGLLIPEQYLGLLPDHFESKVELEKELERIRNDPLYHYHHQIEEAQLHKRYKTKRPSVIHRKKMDPALSKKNTRSSILFNTTDLMQTMNKSMYIFRIAFTGGDQGGKHMILDLVAKAVLRDGFDVYMCPKIFEFFKNHGVHLDPKMSKQEHILFQAELLRTQLRLEKAMVRFAGLSDRPGMVLFNRGLPDIKAHCDEDEWKAVLKMCEITEDYMLDRYDMVLHCETQCKNPNYNGELDKEKAIAIDQKYVECWQSHPEQVILQWVPEFEEKVNLAIDETLSCILKHNGASLLSRCSLGRLSIAEQKTDRQSITSKIICGNRRNSSHVDAITKLRLELKKTGFKGVNGGEPTTRGLEVKDEFSEPVPLGAGSQTTI